ncbi:hypothetical protein LDENG_00228310 [Lucifuga dentata]|nr:hypothetical protein LDENG_00228310 [Lucifuga dentata]
MALDLTMLGLWIFYQVIWLPLYCPLSVIALFVAFVQLWLQTLSTSLLLYFECNSFAKKEAKCTINKVKDEFD